MGRYRVWVVGPDPLQIIRAYDEEHDIGASFPGLTFDFIEDIEERGPAHHFAALPDAELPFALVTPEGQIVAQACPGSRPDPSVAVGTDEMRRWLESHPDEAVTPMTWHT